MMDWREKVLLIAEDEDANFMLLVEYLEPSGIQILRANNGEEAVEMCLGNQPHLILMDLKMPKMTGFEAVKKIRLANCNIPVIAQTAYTMLGDKEKAIDAGCNDYISKPIDEELLILKMSLYLETSDLIEIKA